MSIAPPPPTERAIPIALKEPFGQVGVRQYFFRSVWTVSLTLTLLFTAMYVRSLWYSDQMNIGSGQEILMFRSMAGRVVIASTTYQGAIGFDMRGVTFDSRRVPENVVDRWEPSGWKTLGLEVKNEPFQKRSSVSGAWIRAKWPLLIALTLVLPMIKIGLVVVSRFIPPRTDTGDRRTGPIAR